MLEFAIQDHEAYRPDVSGQTSTPAATSLNNKMSSAATGFEDSCQMNMPHNSYHVASQQVYNEAVMSSQLIPLSHEGAFDMTLTGNALPAMSSRPHHTAHYIPVSGQPYNLAPSSPMTHQLSPMVTFGGQSVPMADPYYYTQTQMHPYYPASHFSHPSNQPGLHGRSNLVYYPNQMMMDYTQPSFFYPQGGQYPQLPSVASAQMPWGPHTSGSLQSDGRNVQHEGGTPNQGNHSQDSPLSKPRIVRGPPRKPRQSDHALWIGNLPPQTDLMALVEHICKETDNVESLFLISKSNCAFANYKDESACSTAQQKLHDSRFQSVRLVSRLRRNTVEAMSGTTVPAGSIAEPIVQTPTEPPSFADETSDGQPHTKDADDNGVAYPVARSSQDLHSVPPIDKFFILKSLTTEDLDLSVRTGIWATQSHNEESLNKAFQSVDNVYLIFSANKSGEYFGYARMMSEMNEDPAAAIKFAPKVMRASEADLPKAIPTDASEFAPRGKIIDDSGRGTIFWEVEREGLGAGSDLEGEARSDEGGASEEEAKTWGKPFKLEWLSTARLPFFRTRGLRNPWNSNREVKIARDGTELEPSVGRKLIALFNRMQNPPSFAHADRASLNFVPTYPAMQPFRQ